MANLADRLRRLKAGNRREGSATCPDKELPVRVPSPGWEALSPLVWRRSVHFPEPFPEQLDLAPFIAPFRKCATVIPLVPGGTGSFIRAGGRLRFFDLETTGLSGGSGTVAFLAAVAEVDQAGIRVNQLYLADYPGEPDFLTILLGLLPETATIVTYNGSGFDIPLLRTRCIMNGIPVPSFDHIDALPLSRRLWRKPCGGASLGAVERGVLGLLRSGDIPSSAVPGIWLEWLRTGSECGLQSVFDHNQLDVISLARLVARTSSLFTTREAEMFRSGTCNPVRYRESGTIAPDCVEAEACPDPYWYGICLIRLGSDAQGEAVLEAACLAGDERAGLALSSRFRVQGRSSDRERILDRLPDTAAAHMERAKYSEHVLRDPEQALAWTERCGRRSDDPEFLAALARRKERLIRKIRRGAAKAQGPDSTRGEAFGACVPEVAGVIGVDEGAFYVGPVPFADPSVSPS